MVGRIAGLVALLAVPAVAHAQPQRAVVAKATSAAGTFAARPPDGKSFEVLGAGAELRAGDLLVALPGATLASKDGAVTLKSFADYDGRSPLPILETAVALGAAEKGADLAFALDRGRVDITNTRASGAAVAAVRFWDEAWTIKLDDPGTRVALEMSGRWPAGSRFKLAEPGAKVPPAEPAASLVLLVLKGSATVTSGDTTLGLSAPPGPAALEWDNVAGAKPQPQKLAALPEWADPESNLSERARKVAAAVEKFRAARAENPGAALKAFLGSADPIEQRLALVTLGATDDLATLGPTLAAAKTAEEWDMGIRVLRHWLGRAPGQDQKLYRFLTGSRGYTEAQAKIVMQLLFGFGAAELRRPETYQVLIDYLGHEKPGIRNLAAWHLVRLVPRGKDIPFKPDGSAADAAKAQAAWKKLIPEGELPPPPKMK
jgi:hypothetical protein